MSVPLVAEVEANGKKYILNNVILCFLSLLHSCTLTLTPNAVKREWADEEWGTIAEPGPECRDVEEIDAMKLHVIGL